MSICTIFRKMESMTSKIMADFKIFVYRQFVSNSSKCHLDDPNTKRIFMCSFILEAHIENKRLNACGHATNK